jgi:cytoskeleton protein RodZ
MSELDSSGAEGAGADSRPDSTPSGGAMLKAAREAAGLHIGALAVMLKVPVKKLEALEADRMDLLPDAVFVRALAASVCRTLRVDAAPILARLPLTAAPKLRTVESGINAPFRVPGADPGMSMRDRATSPLALAVLALFVGALILVFAPSSDRLEQMLGLTRRDVPALPAPGLGDIKPAEAGAAAAVAEPTLAAASASPGDAASTAPLPAPVAAPVVAAPVPLPTPAPAPSPAAAPTPAAVSVPTPSATDVAGSVVIKARGPSWVEVTDAAGVVQLRKMMNAGEGVGVSGKRPLSVVVGRADVVDVMVSGKPFELLNVSRDKVARFEVK